MIPAVTVRPDAGRQITELEAAVAALQASPGGSQPVKIVDLGTIDWAAVFTGGPQTLYELQPGEALAAIRYLDDVYEALDSIPLAGYAGIGTTRSFSWWSFAATRFNFVDGDPAGLPPLDTLGMFVRNYRDELDRHSLSVGQVALNIPSNDGTNLGITYGPDLSTSENPGNAQVLSAVGDVQAAFAYYNNPTPQFGFRIAGVGAWAADTAYDAIQDPYPTIDAPPQKVAIVANGTIWMNNLGSNGGAAGTSGSSEPDFAGNAGGQVADGPDVIWGDTTYAPPAAGQIHAVAEIWIAT